MTTVTLVKEFPVHGSFTQERYDSLNAKKIVALFVAEVWNSWQGRPITVGTPVPPRHWNCDTDLIWPVLTKEYVAACGPAPVVYLCRHMIEGAD